MQPLLLVNDLIFSGRQLCDLDRPQTDSSAGEESS